MSPASSGRRHSRLHQTLRLVCVFVEHGARQSSQARAWRDFSRARRLPFLLGRLRVTSPAAGPLEVLASSRFLVLFLLTRLLFLCRVKAILGRWQSRGLRGRRCRRRRLEVSWLAPGHWGAACCSTTRTGTACRAPTAEMRSRLDLGAHASVACWLIFRRTPVARSITSKLEPP